MYCYLSSDSSPESEPERREYETQHRVTLCKGFYLGVHSVTQAQWRSVMGSTPSRFKGDSPITVSWDDCQEFCKKLGQQHGKRYRLPTEAEWEYACRAGTTTPFHFGEKLLGISRGSDYSDYSWTIATSGSSVLSGVGSLPPNAWSLYDMHGYVYEWCQDWYGPYPAFDVVDPQGAQHANMGGEFWIYAGSAEHRVRRGGSLHDNMRCRRSASRNGDAPGRLVRGRSAGCRVVLCLD